MPAPKAPHTPPSHATRLARRAWLQLHKDSRRSIALADRALAAALAAADATGEAWARLARGFHLLYFATPTQATAELERARGAFAARGDRAGVILASAGLARSAWRAGRFDQALELVLPLRDEGLRVLRPEQRGVLLNTIAGGYSAMGRSDQAFAYMYQALRDAGPARGHGFDVVLYCNLAHELLLIGDHGEALRHVDLGLARSEGIANARLLSVLLINRVLCLTELGRPAEALPDIVRLGDLPADTSGRGVLGAHFETLAIAALRAGELELGAGLVAQAQARAQAMLPEERLELAVAQALLALHSGEPAVALAKLDGARALAEDDATAGLSLRARCLFFATLSQVHEAGGDAGSALHALKIWRRLHTARTQLASAARYQAAALHTELLRLKLRLEENDARRRATERARAELSLMNQQLSRKVTEVESLQQALRQQASRDALTGLFNRRHLNDTLPAMFALAQRDGRPLAVVIIDLDHFKAVNDTHGHDAGDRLLQAFGELLAEDCRKSDVACRYGGEEFCLLMPRTDAAGARRKVSALLRRWREQTSSEGGLAASPVTFSAGVADSTLTAAGPVQLLKAADEALLRAKRSGRNQVHVASGASALPAPSQAPTPAQSSAPGKARGGKSRRPQPAAAR
jgi:diguanylate cyclase (GGDEF)-like protein